MRQVWVWDSGFRFGIRGLGLQFSDLGLRASDFESGIWDLGSQVSPKSHYRLHRGRRTPCDLVSGSGFQVSSFGFEVLKF
jgi:hypothetical protein